MKNIGFTEKYTLQVYCTLYVQRDKKFYPADRVISNYHLK